MSGWPKEEGLGTDFWVGEKTGLRGQPNAAIGNHTRRKLKKNKKRISDRERAGQGFQRHKSGPEGKQGIKLESGESAPEEVGGRDVLLQTNPSSGRK